MRGSSSTGGSCQSGVLSGDCFEGYIGCRTRYHLLCLFEGADGNITRTGADFDDDIGGLEEGLVHNGIADTGVLENVLAKVLVEAEDVGAGSSLGRRLAVVGPAAGAGPLLLGRLGHCGCFDRCRLYRLSLAVPHRSSSR